MHTHTTVHTHTFLQRAVLYLTPITCQIHSLDQFVTMKLPAAGRHVEISCLQKLHFSQKKRKRLMHLDYWSPNSYNEF